MTVRAFSFAEIEKEIKANQFKFIGVKNDLGKSIMNQNPIGSDPIKFLRDVVVPRLNSQITPDGLYYITAKTRNDKGAVVVEFPFTKGKVNMLKPGDLPNEKQMITYEKAIELSSENARLQAENDNLLRENERLQSDLSAYQTRINELQISLDSVEKNGVAENGTNWGNILKDLAPVVVPLVAAPLAEYFKGANMSKEAALIKTKAQYGLLPHQIRAAQKLAEQPVMTAESILEYFNANPEEWERFQDLLNEEEEEEEEGIPGNPERIEENEEEEEN